MKIDDIVLFLCGMAKWYQDSWLFQALVNVVLLLGALALLTYGVRALNDYALSVSSYSVPL